MEGRKEGRKQGRKEGRKGAVMKPPKRAGDPGRGSGRQQLSNSKLGMSGVQMNPSLEATSLLHFYYLSCIQR
jgi:hypothetical protein